MKQKDLSKVLISIAALLVFAIVCYFFIIPNIRWDKVPVIGLFVLGISKSTGVDATNYNEPITCEQFITLPDDWTQDRGYWFSTALNKYTKGLIYDYMKENNLGIVPNDYAFYSTYNFEGMLEVLEFVPLD